MEPMASAFDRNSPVLEAPRKMSNILADSTTELAYTPAGFVPASEAPEGSTIFKLRCLNYWEAREVLALKDDLEAIRRTLDLALVSIDGDAAKAKEFLACPKPKLINPLFNAARDIYLGE